MAGRSLLTHLVALVLGAAVCGAVVWRIEERRQTDVSREKRRLILLQSENDRLRSLVEKDSKAKSAAASIAQRQEIEKAVEEIRGLKFKQPVDYNVLSRKEIKDVVSGKLAEVFSEQEFQHMSAAFSRLGLLPEKYPLRQSYIELLGEQIAAFYDQHTHKLFMFEDASLDNAQNRIVLAHELTHALQDQHFGLKKLPLEIKTNDDRAMAASALVEGEATLVMSEFMLKNLSLGTLKDTVASTLTQNMDQLQKAPRFLREALIFPYLRGQEFSTALFSRGGYSAISKAYDNPPTSSTQILHPEKYLGAQREDPVEVQWPVVEVDGQKPTSDNVVGEFITRILLAEGAGDGPAEDAAEGWRGDRYLSFGDGESLVWKSIWASEDDAREFLHAEKGVLEKRYTPAAPRNAEDSFEADAPRALRLRRIGETVVMIDAPSPEIAAKLQEQFGK
jgi:hypothetical protein